MNSSDGKPAWQHVRAGVNQYWPTEILPVKELEVKLTEKKSTQGRGRPRWQSPLPSPSCLCSQIKASAFIVFQLAGERGRRWTLNRPVHERNLSKCHRASVDFTAGDISWHNLIQKAASPHGGASTTLEVMMARECCTEERTNAFGTREKVFGKVLAYT